MSSPNEPGQPRAGDRPAHGDVTTDIPPWQNSARSRPDGPPNRTVAAPPAAAELRTNRYVTGTAAPDLSGLTTPSGQRTDVVGLVEPIPSELPDLSGPVPRPPQHRRPGPDVPMRPAAPPIAAADPAATAGRSRGPVRASMQIRRIDPWSALKVSLLLNVALFFVWMIAVAFLYLVLGAMGVWSKLNSNVGDLLTSGSSAGGDLVSAGSVFGGAALIGLVNIVLLTAMATVGAYIYNLSTDIVGGVEVTLADLD
ncbi:MAG: hypothetical protein FGM52_00335 [Mycobacterium sp.]|nr:hypothetical protein [Mycobacterium sp.]